jgi:hypothetical protein
VARAVCRCRAQRVLHQGSARIKGHGNPLHGQPRKDKQDTRAETELATPAIPPPAAAVPGEAAGRTRQSGEGPRAGGICHDLRTPLNAILEWAQAARAVPDMSTDLNEALSRIEANTWLQGLLINDILDLPKSAAGGLRVECQPVDLKRRGRGGAVGYRAKCGGRTDSGRVETCLILGPSPGQSSAASASRMEPADRRRQVHPTMARACVEVSGVPRLLPEDQRKQVGHDRWNNEAEYADQRLRGTFRTALQATRSQRPLVANARWIVLVEEHDTVFTGHIAS